MIRFENAGESGDNTKKTSFCSFWLLKASFLPDKVKNRKKLLKIHAKYWLKLS